VLGNVTWHYTQDDKSGQGPPAPPKNLINLQSHYYLSGLFFTFFAAFFTFAERCVGQGQDGHGAWVLCAR
jgi:hypothetical protein